MNIYDYIEKYGNTSFKDKSITDIDILIFSCFAYNDFSLVLPNLNDKTVLNDSIDVLIASNDNARGLSRNTGRTLLNALKDKDRYKDLILKNYFYELGDNYQFGAITIETNDTLYVCFEGTDSTLEGWKEDFALSYLYPSESQLISINYLNKVTRFSSKKIVLCGHSKGGNLAVVSSLGLNPLKRNKLVNIYSFDGPGLHNGIYGSEDYNKIKDKVINYIPEQSLFGIFLYQDTPTVIKSTEKGISQHDATSWIVDDDNFVLGTQDKSSIELKEAIERWVFSSSLEERKQIIDIFFNLMKEANIEKMVDFTDNISSNIIIMLKNAKDLSDETKELLWNSGKILIQELSKYKKENINIKVRTLFKNNN